MATEVTDEELVRLALAGDQDAYAELYRRMLPRMKRIAYKMLPRGTDFDAEAHDMVVHVLMKLAQFKGNSLLKTWAHRAGTNLTCEVHRRRYTLEKRANGPLLSLDETPVGWEHAIAPQVPDSRDHYAAVEARLDTEKVMAWLPPGYRSVLDGHYLREELFAVTAERLDRSVGYCKASTFRGLLKARQMMECHV